MSTIHPLISIGIPTYNRANGYLKQAIQASLNQNYPELEIIVSDNCSPDKTEDLVKGFADPRIRYFRQSENIGMNNNFNFCVRQARGAYFLLLPDDDLIDDDFIDVCMQAANYDTNIGIIRTGTRLINEKNEVIAEYKNRVVGLSTLDFFLGWFAGKTAPYMCSTLFNSGRLKEIGGFHSKHNLFQDVGAEARLVVSNGRVDVHDVKASFRKHTEELTHAAKIGAWCEDSLELLDLICDLIPEERSLIRTKGMPFMAYLSYNRARAVRSTMCRLAAFMIVFKKFHFRHLPTKRQLTHKIA
jgi:glycosyltransferase involved in cell wall biosynthesis